MDQRDRWSLAWTAYVAATVTGFAVLEALAMRQPPPHPTLSRSLARWFGCHPRARRGSVTPAAFVAASAALAVHVARYQPGALGLIQPPCHAPRRAQ